MAGQELELSPRHEQAKQLLQRARMKARTNPLRASHDILLLPAAAPRPRSVPSCPTASPGCGAHHSVCWDGLERAHGGRHACGAGIRAAARTVQPCIPGVCPASPRHGAWLIVVCGHTGVSAGGGWRFPADGECFPGWDWLLEAAPPRRLALCGRSCAMWCSRND